MPSSSGQEPQPAAADADGSTLRADPHRDQDRSPSSRLGADCRSWLPFVLVCAVVFGLRWHVVDQVVINWDESVYWYVAHDMVTGGSLYRTAFDHKGPLLYVVLAAPTAAFGNSIRALRLTGTIVLLLTMLFVELIARRLVGRQRAFVAPLYYGLFFSVPVFGGLAVRTELVMMLPISAALLCFLVARDQGGWRRRLWFVLCGVSTAAALLVKGIAAHSLAVIPVMMLAAQLRREQRDLRQLLRDAAAIAAGLVGVLAATVYVFLRAGALHELIYSNITVNRVLAAGQATSQSSPTHWVAPFLSWAVQADPFTMLLLASLVLLGLSWRELARSGDTPWMLAALTVFSFLGFAVSPYMFFHYYLQLALPFALIVAFAGGRLGITDAAWQRVAHVGLLLAAVTAFSPLRSAGGRHTRAAAMDDTLNKVARDVALRSAPGDRIFVLGGEPIIYLLADRKAPTRYFWWVLSDDEFDPALHSRAVVLADLQRDPPKLFVYRQQEPRIPELERFMVAHYRPCAKIDDYQIAQLN